MGERAEDRKVWIDMTNSPHVLVLRPIVLELERRGWEVTVTVRDFAQTLPLVERFGIEHTVIGRHRGRKMAAKAMGMASRTAAMVRFGAGKGFHLALSHTSNDLPVASWLLRIPHVTMFDYEFAKLAHHINVRFSTRAFMPEAIPLAAVRQFGGRPGKVQQYAGLKEEYYLADFEPNPKVVEELGLDLDKVLITVRTPPTMAAYHRMGNPLFQEVLHTIAKRSDTQAVILLRTPDQRASVEELGATNLIVPTGVVDAQSLIYYSDLVISAGGTVNREAAALGTPVYTIFKGTMGALDERLIAEGRLRTLTTASAIRFEKKPQNKDICRRDVPGLVDRLIAVAKHT